jgi:hypothetical protein
MKRSIIASLAMLLATTAFPQVSVTYKDHSPLPGDPIVYRPIKYVLPGEAGPDKLWDFSKMQDSGKSFVSRVNPQNAKELKDAREYNIIATEDEYTYYNNINREFSEIKGCTSDRISLVYSNSLITMKYPFAYGDHFTDTFVSNAIKDSVMAIRADGEVNVSADAYGTLVLPDRMIRNSLRVKTEKNSIDVGPCGMADRHTVQYQWYATGFRYPVLTVTRREVTYNGQEIPVVTQTAYYTVQQGRAANSTANIKGQKDPVDNSEYAVISWPNPFSEDFSYCFFIRNRMAVTVGLYDMSGKLLFELLNNPEQTDGLYTASFNADVRGLTPGVYYIRFTFDKKTVVNKVVKI